MHHVIIQKANTIIFLLQLCCPFLLDHNFSNRSAILGFAVSAGVKNIGDFLVPNNVNIRNEAPCTQEK